MTALLAPARLPALSTVEEDLEYVDHDSIDGLEGRTFYWRHGYLRSLALGGGRRRSWDGKQGETKQRVLGRRQSETTVAAPGACRKGYRSLSEPFVETNSKRMATAAVTSATEENAALDTAPSSPPELSYSKSSNSSERSDSSDEERSTEKLAHLEDRSIEDVSRDSYEDSNLRPESRPTLKRPLQRSQTAGGAVVKVATPPLGSPEIRTSLLRAATNGVLRDQSLNLPSARGLRRGFTSPSTPALVTHGSPRMSSRSPSPTKPFMQNGISVSPSALANATPRLSTEVRSPNPNAPGTHSRRGSWQPGRKTVKEREAEYNNEDEEVPDEYVLENVPVSPMPGQRLSQSFSRPQSRSTTPSPHRKASHTNLHSANVPKKVKRPSAPRVLPNGQYGSPRSPKSGRPPMAPHSITTGAFPGEPLGRKQRSKSWTEELSDEARQLSAALDEYSERLSMDKHGFGTSSLSSSPPIPGLSMKRAKTSILDLPPAQKGSVMIDPLPISKEKEAVLTRTRPSWLPPKCPKEDQKHMKEWEYMMARAAETQKKRVLKEREALESQEELTDSIARIWDQHVLPNWDVVVKEPRTRELWWRGVTPRSRGLVWQKAIGNELELSEASFEAALTRAVEIEQKLAEMSSDERSKSKEAAWFDAISRDVPSTCPELTDPDKRAPFQDALRDVLKAYSSYRGDVGYVYGTHLIAGVLCLHMRPADAFVALANMLNRPIPLAFLVHDTRGMAHAYDLVLKTLKYKLPKLHDHLTSTATDLKPEEYLDPIFRCLFAYNLPTEHVNRIWDIFVFEGDKALIRATVAVLSKLESNLYGSRDEILDIISWRNEKRWDVGPEEDFIQAVREAGKVDSKGEVKNS